MKRVYVNEEWCLGCHLREYNCAFANSGMTDMATALQGKPIYPRIQIVGNDKISYAISCRHCTGPIGGEINRGIIVNERPESIPLSFVKRYLLTRLILAQ